MRGKGERDRVPFPLPPRPLPSFRDCFLSDESDEADEADESDDDSREKQSFRERQGCRGKIAGTIRTNRTNRTNPTKLKQLLFRERQGAGKKLRGQYGQIGQIRRIGQRFQGETILPRKVGVPGREFVLPRPSGCEEKSLRFCNGRSHCKTPLSSPVIPPHRKTKLSRKKIGVRGKKKARAPLSFPEKPN